MTAPLTLTDSTEGAPARLRRLPDIPPIVLALVAQVVGIGLTLPLVWSAPIPAHWTIPALMLIHGTLAALCGRALGLALWWMPINALFVPAAVLCSGSAIGPGWFLGGFVLLTLVYWSTFRTQVPLYLTSTSGCRVVGEILAREKSAQASGGRFLDLGSGSGTVLAHVTQRFPAMACEGVELAPIPYWISKLRLLLRRNCRILWRDFWGMDLSQYDVVYAFLSPVPMARLWEKVRREMRPGTLFISNSFPVVGVVPKEVVVVPGPIKRKLYLWRL